VHCAFSKEKGLCSIPGLIRLDAEQNIERLNVWVSCIYYSPFDDHLFSSFIDVTVLAGSVRKTSSRVIIRSDKETIRRQLNHSYYYGILDPSQHAETSSIHRRLLDPRNWMIESPPAAVSTCRSQDGYKPRPEESRAHQPVRCSTLLVSPLYSLWAYLQVV
jgi:hypothetical protein